MPYCRSCGLMMGDGAPFCATCGTNVDAAPVSSVSPIPPTLVATFSAATAWVGKTITYADGQFNLEDHGPIKAEDALAYDQKGQLDWAHDGMRAWVQSKGAQHADPATLSTPSAAAGRLERPREDSQGRTSVSAAKRRPISKVTAVVVIGIVAFIAIIGIAAAMSSMHGSQGQAGNAYNDAVNQIGAGSTYTLAQFNQLQTGMTKDQVTSILGSGGTMTAQNSLAGTTTEAYSYQNPSGSNMQLMFQNGALIQKAQFGLQ